MIRWLVEQQYVGFGRQNAGERGATGLAARKGRRLFGSGQAQFVEQIMRAVVVAMRPEARRDIIESGFKAGKIRLLRQIAHGGVGLEKAQAVIGFDFAGGDFQQRRFAGAVAADKTQPVAALDRQVGGFDQRLAAKSEADALKDEERRSHARIKRKF